MSFKIPASIKLSFSATIATEDDAERFRDASGSCGAALVLILWLAGVVSNIARAADGDKAFVRFGDRSGYWLLGAAIFLAAVVTPYYRTHTSIRLPYWLGTLCNTVAFSFLSMILFFLVLWSGGLSVSIFQSAYIASFGIAGFVPKDRVMKCLLIFIVSALSIILLFLAPPERQRRDIAIFVESTAAYGLAWFSMHVLNHMKHGDTTAPKDG
jgi:hypothetical protein